MKIVLPTKKFGDVTVLIDDEDEFLVTDKKLCVIKNNNHLYVINSDKKYLHRLLVGAKKGQVVDHINHNTLDNRKCNLRICTQLDNKLNSYKAFTDTQKLKKEDVKEILTSDKSNNELAIIYNVSSCLISKVRAGKMYANYFPEIKRRCIKASERLSLERRKEIKEKVLNCSTTIYQLAKELNIAESILYRIKNGKIWKGV